jgi:DegV family protein with EDD domain
MQVAIVTDSTSDIPPRLAREVRVSVVPAIIVIDGEDFEDGDGISREDFYRQLPEMLAPPTTAAPASGSFTETYNRLFEGGVDRILSIHVAAQLSAIYNAAHIAAQSFAGRVQVIESGQVSMGLGFQALAAAEMAAAGVPLDQIRNEISSVRRRVRVVAMLDTLEYLRRSGRVSWVQANLGSLLRVKPFLEVREGEVLRLGQVRTRRKGFSHLLENLQSLGPLESLAVLHTNAPEEAASLFEAYGHELPKAPEFINVTSVIGTHVGPNGLGFAAILADQ